ncbi:hypothetical protein ANCCEY_10776 [Ancylostoma ceylanicum]|uniref:MULE transposase domain-containing protein n=1 Tax=Ancylostoma ceylanicum TaxID=53326 RepID=A0A0D6LDF6_9BILA|nr:hypothetical protein ANCCEY_10776 [Ancylostoma ceylanicum]
MVEVEHGQTFPLLFAFLPDGTIETYTSMFRWIWQQIGTGREKIQGMDSAILMDFEMAAMNAVRAEWGKDVLGCLFHFGNAIQRNRDKHGLREAAKKKPKAAGVADVTRGPPRSFRHPDSTTTANRD